MVALIGKPRMALTDAPRKKTCAQERTALVTDILNLGFSQVKNNPELDDRLEHDSILSNLKTVSYHII